MKRKRQDRMKIHQCQLSPGEPGEDSARIARLFADGKRATIKEMEQLRRPIVQSV